MSEFTQSVNVREYMTHHLVEVFDTMLSMKAAPVRERLLPRYRERVTGCVGFAGADVNGAVYLHLSAEFAVCTAAAMLGLQPDEISGEAEVNDVVGEVANMLAGGLKSTLCNAGNACAISTPAIIRGNSFVIEPMPDVERLWLMFACGKERLVVEVHIKYN